MGSPAHAGQPGTHLHHAAERDSAVGHSHGEARQPEGREALGDAASEGERLAAHHLEGVSHQASRQDHKDVACCSGEISCENLPGAQEARQEVGAWAAEVFQALGTGTQSGRTILEACPPQPTSKSQLLPPWALPGLSLPCPQEMSPQEGWLWEGRGQRWPTHPWQRSRRSGS